MAGKKYIDKLKDPRWQKIRLHILERDNWTCPSCGDTKTTLVVHHKKYLPNTEPWDYPDSLLTTLCEDCHRQEIELRPILENQLLDTLRIKYPTAEIYLLLKLEESGLLSIALQKYSDTHKLIKKQITDIREDFKNIGVGCNAT